MIIVAVLSKWLDKLYPTILDMAATEIPLFNYPIFIIFGINRG